MTKILDNVIPKPLEGAGKILDRCCQEFTIYDCKWCHARKECIEAWDGVAQQPENWRGVPLNIRWTEHVRFFMKEWRQEIKPSKGVPNDMPGHRFG